MKVDGEADLAPGEAEAGNPLGLANRSDIFDGFELKQHPAFHHPADAVPALNRLAPADHR